MDNPPIEHHWNIASIYQDPNQLEEDLLAFSWQELCSWKARELTSVALAKEFFDLYFSHVEKIDKMQTYAMLYHDTRCGDPLAIHLKERISTKARAFEQSTSFAQEKWISMPQEVYEAFISNPECIAYKHLLEVLWKEKDRYLGPHIEQLLSKSAGVSSHFYKAYNVLCNVDAVFKDAYNSHGEKIPVNHSMYPGAIASSDAKLRESVYESMSGFYAQNRHLFSELLTGSCKEFAFHAKERGYKGPLDAALLSKAIDPSIPETLIETVVENREHLHAYIKKRKEQMALDRFFYRDIHAAHPDEKKEMNLSFEEGCAIVLEALAPLGQEYVAVLRKGMFEEGWIDATPSARKKSGAYSSICHGTAPFILLSWTGGFESLFTLAHECGHSMHTYLADNAQPYPAGNYTIFAAEIASICNELLLADYLLKREDFPKKQVAFEVLSRFNSAFFRQTLFSHLELDLHRKIWNEEPVTSEWIEQHFKELVALYYGPDLELDDLVGCGIFRIPHLYKPFYVFQYATGITASVCFFDLIQTGKEGVQTYMNFLRSGGSDFPLKQLEKAGIDMRSKKTYQAVIDLFVEKASVI